MSRNWRLFLRDIIVFCQNVIDSSQGLSRGQLESDAIRYDAILRNIELIGEAARNLPVDVRALAAEIPWNDVIAIRNVLAHVYFGVDKEVVWNVVSVEVPWLLERLKHLEQCTIGLPD